MNSLIFSSPLIVKVVALPCMMPMTRLCYSTPPTSNQPSVVAPLRGWFVPCICFIFILLYWTTLVRLSSTAPGAGTVSTSRPPSSPWPRTCTAGAALWRWRPSTARWRRTWRCAASTRSWATPPSSSSRPTPRQGTWGRSARAGTRPSPP